MQTNCRDIDTVVEQIISLTRPQKIILFSRKRAVLGETSSFKLCVITDTDQRRELERRIYLEVDCEIPFDVVIYTPAQWQDLLAQNGSFAQRVEASGSVLYE